MGDRPLAAITVGHGTIASVLTPVGLISRTPIHSASFACHIFTQKGVGGDSGWKREGEGRQSRAYRTWRRVVSHLFSFAFIYLTGTGHGKN